MRFLKATRIFSGLQTLPATSVLVLNHQNVLKEIVHETAVEKSNIEVLEGILTPGFINAHCHLELSHLAGRFPKHSGLPAFGKQVITQRNVGAEAAHEHMQEADRQMYNNGIVAVGDISNTPQSFDPKTRGKLFYHTFIELIGLHPGNEQSILAQGQALLRQLTDKGLQGSLAPHAPYSTSTGLMRSIADHNLKTGSTTSIHSHESDEEIRFLDGKKSAFHELYQFLGIDLSWYKPPGSALVHLSAALQGKRLFVHNTLSTRADVEAVGGDNTWWCFCPNANEYIENRLPDFEIFEPVRQMICIGTDSLAGNTALDVLNEANTILAHSQAFTAEDLLRAMTCNSARALGLNDYGLLTPGKPTGLNLVGFLDNKFNLKKKIN